MKIFSGRTLICTLAFFSLTAFSAQAYVLPAEQVLELMVKAQGPAKGLSVAEQVVVYPPPEIQPEQAVQPENDAASSGMESREGEAVGEESAEPAPLAPLTLEGSVSYQFPDKFREEIKYPTGLGILAVSPAGAAKVENNHLISEFEDQYDLFKEPLLYRNALLLQERLSLAGVRTDVCSLGYWQGKAAFVIGAQFPDETVPQLWVEKNTFLPIRFIVTRAASGGNQDSLEVQYSDWQGLLVQDGKKIRHRYPGRITFVSNGQIVSQRTMVNYAMNPSFPPESFDVSRMRRAYEPAPHLMPQDPVSEEMQGVHNAFEVFKKTIGQDGKNQ
ncbi:hypothetical protein SAMN02745216_01135 [Desulfatibacillum alkenivorans DSM 16219]|jgi:hypothetical protein|uniref:Uncharacterized protein n=1 Tax=Desulfatibacillum alkenivorans DSM 16219 TaxID=1121393 RepID=A0A1M6GXA7_9BACT|nr:hypothetical protein [Desulfatibacillum alkenivorans]SHJ14581.1 hypothetical protein SAMN02745216_01135 [Desulfatibacillum alkenivorans DSM 16219]